MKNTSKQPKLFQKCPECGITEAAGGYCTQCLSLIDPKTWHRWESSIPREVLVERISRARAYKDIKTDQYRSVLISSR